MIQSALDDVPVLVSAGTCTLFHSCILTSLFPFRRAPGIDRSTGMLPVLLRIPWNVLCGTLREVSGSWTTGAAEKGR
jgi:hypothetical protein